jgi:hypothetical protein
VARSLTQFGSSALTFTWSQSQSLSIIICAKWFSVLLQRFTSIPWRLIHLKAYEFKEISFFCGSFVSAGHGGNWYTSCLH